MLKPLLAFFIFSHSGYLSDSIDLDFSKTCYINPNTATFSQLAQIPFLSSDEISMILTMRKERPFKSIYDFEKRIGLMPFETEYLQDILYFGKKYSLWFSVSYDTTIHYITNYVYDGEPVFSIWEHHKRTYFMQEVKTKYFSIMQGYIRPIFTGNLLENTYYIPRHDGIKRDTSYNFLFLSKHFLFFYSPSNIKLRTKIKNIVLESASDSTKKHINGFLSGIEGKNITLKFGIKEHLPIFYIKGERFFSHNKVFYDIYSKYTTYRTYGAHLYMRTKVLKNLNLKTYGAYKHSYKTYMRFSSIMQYRIWKNHTFFNIGIKKLYTTNARFYLSTGIWGKNYMYFSLTKDIGTPSYMLRYGFGLYNFSLTYLISSNDADYIFLDTGEQRYFLGKVKERFNIRYKLRYKSFTLKVEYMKGERSQFFRAFLSGRFYH